MINPGDDQEEHILSFEEREKIREEFRRIQEVFDNNPYLLAQELVKNMAKNLVNVKDLNVVDRYYFGGNEDVNQEGRQKE